MSSELLYVLIGLICALLGVAIGIYIQQLKTKSSVSVWDEKERQLNATIDELKNNLSEQGANFQVLQNQKRLLARNW